MLEVIKIKKKNYGNVKIIFRRLKFLFMIKEETV